MVAGCCQCCGPYRDKIGGAVKEFTEFSDSGIAYCLERFEAFFANMSFEEFVDAVVAIPDEEADEHFQSQNLYLTNSKGETAVDFVGRYENLEADFRYVSERIGLPSTIELPRLHVSRHSVNYVDYYTKETREIVAHRFREDIERFAYCFGS